MSHEPWAMRYDFSFSDKVDYSWLIISSFFFAQKHDLFYLISSNVKTFYVLHFHMLHRYCEHWTLNSEHVHTYFNQNACNHHYTYVLKEIIYGMSCSSIELTDFLCCWLNSQHSPYKWKVTCITHILYAHGTWHRHRHTVVYFVYSIL